MKKNNNISTTKAVLNQSLPQIPWNGGHVPARRKLFMLDTYSSDYVGMNLATIATRTALQQARRLYSE